MPELKGEINSTNEYPRTVTGVKEQWSPCNATQGWVMDENKRILLGVGDWGKGSLLAAHESSENKDSNLP